MAQPAVPSAVDVLPASGAGVNRRRQVNGPGRRPVCVEGDWRDRQVASLVRGQRGSRVGQRAATLATERAEELAGEPCEQCGVRHASRRSRGRARVIEDTARDGACVGASSCIWVEGSAHGATHL